MCDFWSSSVMLDGEYVQDSQLGSDRLGLGDPSQCKVNLVLSMQHCHIVEHFLLLSFMSICHTLLTSQTGDM